MPAGTLPPPMYALPFRRRSLLYLCVPAALCAVLAACAGVTVPNLPASDLPAHWRNAPRLGAAPDLTGWWTHFHDPELDRLVATALADNLSVAQARLKLRAARQVEDASTAKFRPQLAFNTLEQPNVENTASYFQAGFDASWELGVFGRGKAAGHLARADIGAAAADLQSARVSLVAEVVREYLGLRAAQRSAALLDVAAAAARAKLELLRMQQHLQLASKLEVDAGIAAAAKAEAAAIDPHDAITQHAYALAVLLGQSEPDPAWLEPAPLPTLGAEQITSLPADLLRTRPEIRYAEAQVLRAAGELGIAEANLFPHLALGSSLTFAALVKGHTRLGDVNNSFAIGPIIDIPLFDWGQRRAVRNARDDELRAAVLAYRQAVVAGAAEVDSDLATLSASGQRADGANAAVTAAQDALRLSRTLRGLGQADGLTVADAELAASDAELDRVRARLAHGLAFVALYKALGGAPLPPAPGAAER
ncbi:MAG TPA: efflux transporter outer membrane subunit [Rhodanobacteraceae bacterium]|nr:efflux transporter outer membrane subunit [Rhodanobacteraceae bacterium]